MIDIVPAHQLPETVDIAELAHRSVAGQGQTGSLRDLSDHMAEHRFEGAAVRHQQDAFALETFGHFIEAIRHALVKIGTRFTVRNLKCDPLLGYGLRQTHADILPAWHMNKQHWITVRLEGDVPEELLGTLIRMSYDLTMKR